MALLKRWRTGVKARIESGKFPFKCSGTKFFNCFDSSACATNINLACLSKNLLLATSSEQGESIHGLLQMFNTTIFEILQVPAILYFALVPEDQMSRAL